MKKLLLIILALCTIFFLAGCDGGGGGGSDDNGGNGGNGGSDTVVYVVTDLADHTGVTSFNIIDGGIQYDLGGHTYQNIVKLTGKSSGTWSLYQKEVEDGVVQCDCTYSGTFTQTGNTINVTCKLTKYTNGDPDDTGTWNDTFTITGEDTIDIWGWVMTKQ